MLRLKSLGQTLIEADDARLTPAAETVFATALYLIIEAGRPVGRDELTRLLWPSVSEARAQHGLRQALYRLKTLGAMIKADRSSLILSPRFCTTDFAELLAPQPPSVQEALAEKVGGSFLPGYCPQLSEQFATWVERQRDIVHSAVARALVSGMQAKKRVSDWNGAEQLAARCLSIDPLNEEATLTVAEAAALGGSKTKALSILNHYLKDIGDNASEIKLPAVLLRRRISEAYQDNIFPVRDAPFVGREEEMAELTRALARAQSGHGSAYVISGEPGIGKTRLVSEFTRVAALQRVHIVRVGCQSHDVRRPLSAFVDLVPKLLALPGALGCAPESMLYLRRLTAHDPEEAHNRDQLEQSNLSYDSARRAVLDVLDAVSAEMCTLLEVEDAQWLDAHSVQMIEEISNWLTSRRVLLLLTSRTTAFSRESISTLALRPLPGDASMIVACALANEKIVAREDFLSWCVQSSGGNPYYLIELLRNGTQERDGYQASASLTRLLQNRVLLLGSHARSLLEVCCILGNHSTMDRIESCLEIPRTTILRALEELDTSGMIELDGSRVLSRHDLLSSVVLTQMSGAVKVLLHRFAAERLESDSAASHSVSLIWESAEHWVAAADSPRAISLLRRCGSYLMDVGMPGEAVRVLEHAESLTTVQEWKYLIATEKARAILRAAQPQDALVVLEKLLRMRASIRPQPSILDEVGAMYTQARWQNGDNLPQLVRDQLDAISFAPAMPHERVRAAAWLLTAVDNLCDVEQGRAIYQRVEGHLADETIAPDARMSFDMIYHCAFGDGERARHVADELIDYASARCPPLIAQRYLRHASYVHRCHTSVERALEVALEAFRLAETLDVATQSASCGGHVASMFMDMGDLDEAESWLSRVSSLHQIGTQSVADSNMWSYRTELAIRRQDVHSAKIFLTHCLPAVARTRSIRSLARRFAFECQIAILNEARASDELLDSFLDTFAVAKRCSYQDFNAESLVLGLASAGRYDEARGIGEDFVRNSRRDLSDVSSTLANTIRRFEGVG